MGNGKLLGSYRHMTLYWFLLAVFILHKINATPCPNMCSGHGHCVDRDCQCYKGFTGGDCSLRTCPVGAAWSDLLAGDEDGHNNAECSNRGFCDRSTGSCHCDVGFEGVDCGRLQCPSSCNQNGVCQSLRYYASMKDPGLGTVYTYTENWDAERIYGCSCDEGWLGPSCSLRHCPTGDDPLSGGSTDPDGFQVNEQQTISCTATGGTFTLTFRGFTTADIDYDTTQDELEEILEAIPSIGEVAVTGSSRVCSSTGNEVIVEFRQDFNDLPLMTPTYDSLTPSSSASMTVVEKTRGTKEDDHCALHGICDTATGVCTCDEGWSTSDGYAKQGARGDCGYTASSIETCPGAIACSGHGVCTGAPTYQCLCAQGWEAHDCAERTCPRGKSWFAYPSSTDVAHNSDGTTDKVECSDMGDCDRDSGTCQCVKGFEGSACDRMRCPGWASNAGECSGHGQCLTMQALGDATTSNGVLAGYTYGSVPNEPATWDFDMIQGCLCDSGYTGHDCGLRVCPFGDDPLTISQVNEIQRISCTATAGTIKLEFRGGEPTATTITDSLDYDSTAAEIETALEGLDTVEDVTVTFVGSTTTFCNSTGAVSLIEFKVPTGDVPLLDYTGSSIDEVVVTEVTASTKEYEECSGRGICDRGLGTCVCFDGFGSSDGQGGRGSRGDCGFAEPIWLGSKSQQIANDAANRLNGVSSTTTDLNNLIKVANS